jgi:hypothetical protein
MLFSGTLNLKVAEAGDLVSVLLELFQGVEGRYIMSLTS